jgi:hypothetical protein
MGNTSSIVSQYVSYEDVQEIIKNKRCILINTLFVDEQSCLIKNTLSIDKEIQSMNKLLDTLDYDKICIYGKNYMDVKINTKYEQLQSLGLKKVYIYGGGLFEWLLLQDIYGDEEFPTTSKDLDILKYRPIRR